MISINISMPKVETDEKHQRPDLCNKVYDYMQECDGAEDSSYHWMYLKTVYEKLKGKNLAPQHQEMMAKLHEFFKKNNSYASDDMLVDMEGEDFAEYKTPEKED